MEITVKIPDEILEAESALASRRILEEIALEGFKSQQLTIAQVRKILGFETRLQVHQFLAAHNVPWVNYSIEDAEREMELLHKLLP